LCIFLALLAILNDNLLQQSFKKMFVHTAVLYTVKRIKKILFITTNSAQYTMTATMMIMMIYINITTAMIMLVASIMRIIFNNKITKW